MSLDYISSFPDFTEVETEVNSYMKKYDARIEREKLKKEEENEEDDDGWVQVTKKSRQPSFIRSEENETRLKLKLKKKMQKEKELQLYSHQIKESKRAKMAELRKKFEEDKEKVSALKRARKFRPY